jgi:hypothetical protein
MLLKPTTLAGIGGGVVVLVVVGIVLWRVVAARRKSSSVGADLDLMMTEEGTISDTLPESMNLVTESNMFSSEVNPTTVNLLDDSDDQKLDD